MQLRSKLVILATVHIVLHSAAHPDSFYWIPPGQAAYRSSMDQCSTQIVGFAQQYVRCKQAAPTTSACIVVPGFVLSVMRPVLKGMHILETFAQALICLTPQICLNNVH